MSGEVTRLTPPSLCLQLPLSAPPLAPVRAQIENSSFLIPRRLNSLHSHNYLRHSYFRLLSFSCFLLSSPPRVILSSVALVLFFFFSSPFFFHSHGCVRVCTILCSTVEHGRVCGLELVERLQPISDLIASLLSGLRSSSLALSSPPYSFRPDLMSSKLGLSSLSSTHHLSSRQVPYFCPLFISHPVCFCSFIPLFL